MDIDRIKKLSVIAISSGHVGIFRREQWKMPFSNSQKNYYCVFLKKNRKLRSFENKLRFVKHWYFVFFFLSNLDSTVTNLPYLIPGLNHNLLQNVNQSWPASNTVDYSQHLLSATLPISLQHFLKYSGSINESIKKETPNNATGNSNNVIGNILNNGNFTNAGDSNNFNLKNDILGLKNGVGSNLNLSLGNLNHLNQHQQNHGFINSNDNVLLGNVNGNNNNGNLNIPSHNSIINSSHSLLTQGQNQMNGNLNTGKVLNPLATKIKKERKKALKPPNGIKKPKKKKAPKEKKPRPKPGEIRETTALDGSKLYLCPECQMAYPERELVEQHVVQHAVERRFVCDVCSAALKRKDHLTRHKLSHIPDRPHACNICMKTFKRKEQLTLHYVIHSGEKKHVCVECNKGFYRKDHLRKHTRSHIAR